MAEKRKRKNNVVTINDGSTKLNDEIGIQKNSAEHKEPVELKVIGNQEPTPIKAFTEEGDIFAGKTKEDILEELGKTGVESEEVTGVVVKDDITGEEIPGTAKQLPDAKFLQDLEPENLKKFFHSIVKQSLSFILPEDFTEEQQDELIKSIEEKLVKLDKKDIKAMGINEIKEIYGAKVYSEIKKLHPQDHFRLAKRILIDFKDGLVEYQGVIDSSEEINRHMKFFQQLDIENVEKNIREKIKENGEKFKTSLHEYKRYLELYLEFLENKEEYKDNPFMEKEKEVTKSKIEAVDEALSFKYIYKKCEGGKEKILKDFKNQQVLNKAIFDFMGKLNNDSTINIPFPVPKNFEVKTNVNEILTTIWITFLEMAIARTKFDNIKNLSTTEYVEMTQILRGQEPKKSKKDKEVEVVSPENKIDLKEFIKENNITFKDIDECRKASIAITYIIARAFKPSILNSSNHLKYVLSYTMQLLTQSIYNDECNSMLNELVEGVRVRLA